MKRQKYIAEYNNKKFIIQEDKPEVGFYVLVYENEVCTMDYLQDDLKMAKAFAEEEFSVPLDSWREVVED